MQNFVQNCGLEIRATCLLTNSLIQLNLQLLHVNVSLGKIPNSNSIHQNVCMFVFLQMCPENPPN